MVTGASEAFIQRHHATSRACGKTCDMRHPLLRNLDVGQEPRGKQTSVSLPAGAFLHFAFALVFHPLCQAFCAMELGAQFVCFIIFSSTLVCWHASTLACIVVWQAHFHIKTVLPTFLSFTQVRFQILFPQVLSGLVACTASCDVATPTSSIVIGLLSGLVVPGLSRILASYCISQEDCLIHQYI